MGELRERRQERGEPPVSCGRGAGGRTAPLVEESSVDKLPQVLAHRVTHVVSLAAVTIIALVALAFASAPWWVYALVIGILVGVTVTLVRFPQLGLEKQHLFEYTMAVVFGRFRAELSQEEPTDKALPEADRPLEVRRLDVYEANQGLFLGHYWRPSEEESQVVDIRIFLHDHPHPDGRPTPLEKGAVESVTYYLGPKFPSRCDHQAQQR